MLSGLDFDFMRKSQQQVGQQENLILKPAAWTLQHEHPLGVLSSRHHEEEGNSTWSIKKLSPHDGLLLNLKKKVFNSPHVWWLRNQGSHLNFTKWADSITSSLTKKRTRREEERKAVNAGKGGDISLSEVPVHWSICHHEEPIYVSVPKKNSLNERPRPLKIQRRKKYQKSNQSTFLPPNTLLPCSDWLRKVPHPKLQKSQRAKANLILKNIKAAKKSLHHRNFQNRPTRSYQCQQAFTDCQESRLGNPARLNHSTAHPRACRTKPPKEAIEFWFKAIEDYFKRLKTWFKEMDLGELLKSTMQRRGQRRECGAVAPAVPEIWHLVERCRGTSPSAGRQYPDEAGKPNKQRLRGAKQKNRQRGKTDERKIKIEVEKPTGCGWFVWFICSRRVEMVEGCLGGPRRQAGR